MNSESHKTIHVEIEPGYESFVPDIFVTGPVEYFEDVGRNIKPGEIKRDDEGNVKEDPTNVKELPVWHDANGTELHTVAKRIDPKKGCIAPLTGTFHEYDAMKIVNNAGLPSPKPIVKVEDGKFCLIVMEKIEGISWYDKQALALKQKGYSDEEILNLYHQAEETVDALKKQFEEAGISREWQMKDMIFDIDVDQKKIRGMIPTDWSCVTVDQAKLDAYMKGKR
jgi:hypothetical protein